MTKNKKKKGYSQLFNSTDLTGLEENKQGYVVKDGNMICDPSLGGEGDLFIADNFGDFIFRFESRLSPFFGTWGTNICRVF